MLSPTGRSRMWDAGADGYARGEGFASILLKTLSQALADGDDIECIIRETGVNQDGRTPGITMPSATAQAALIQSTYRKAGLDPTTPQGRCQVFEAHGTGTPAGDPMEARAIRDVFFPSEADGSVSTAENNHDDENNLYVGSIKTVIGHLEGTAGLAGLLKASLAVQHGLVPPNMHFDALSPAVAPFYKNLEIPTSAQHWPALPPGTPRRVSVNSFGFGGTNAHAIIERFEPEQHDNRPDGVDIGPLVLSARSQSSLLALIASYSGWLKDQPAMADATLGNVRWTLAARREAFQYRASFSGRNRQELITKLDAATETAVTSAIPVTKDLPPRILGIFTGQGAQWPRMGYDLYQACALFRESLEALDTSLHALPDGPAWSLVDELALKTDKSRIHEAEISQPLCTAIQIALVDVLKAAGIRFSAVVGHSSGEIAAAYTADYLTAADAIRIAYYRGKYAHLAAGNNKCPGKMMAVGMAYQDAVEFCSLPQFAGRISAAASNSRSSTTVSGDADAIDEAKALLDEDKVFARLLKVSTAYHSHHMQPCVDNYIQSMRQCKIEPQQPGSESCHWYSSVHGPNGRSMEIADSLRDSYWVDNMVRPVLFSQALERAINEENCHDVVIEVGPHPALKGPAVDTLKTLTGLDLPYTGLLSRDKDDVNSLSDVLGFIWAHFQSPEPAVDFASFRKAAMGDKWYEPSVMKCLPTYRWDHDRALWKESAVSRNFRTRQQPIHELLGARTSQGQGQEVRWRNIFKVKEMEWVKGHQFQGQILFPAAGYVSMAVEAAVDVARENHPGAIELVELGNLKIHQAITLDEADGGTEVSFTIRIVSTKAQQIKAEYSCYSRAVDATSSMEKHNFSGSVVVSITQQPKTTTAVTPTLPSRTPTKLPMSHVGLDRLYRSLQAIGLDYTGDFVVESLQRRLNSATVTLSRSPKSGLVIHPATLDAAFHSLFGAYCFPEDGRLWTAYLPTSIEKVRVDIPRLTQGQPEDESGANHNGFIADCNLTTASTAAISGDINLFSSADDSGYIQVQGLTCSSFTVAKAQDDRKLFSHTVWKLDISSGIEEEDTAEADVTSSNEDEYCTIVDRLCYFYYRQFSQQVAWDELPASQVHFQHLMNMVNNHLLPTVQAGRHARIKAEWATDTAEMIEAWEQQYKGLIDIDLCGAVGRNLPAIVRGEVPALQVMKEADMLDRLYKEGVGFDQANRQLAQVADQISHRYPQMKILEIGAGTGGATVTAINAMASKFQSYTYTDISPAFFETATELLQDHLARLTFKTLDIERDPIEQGYEEHSYDLIIAANVLHATRFLETTMHNCRRLLRPGGYLLLMEITGFSIRADLMMSALPGWWLGYEDGRLYRPTISELEWDAMLRKTGFSGIDGVRRDSQDYMSVICSQAVDERVSVLREPLYQSQSNHVPSVGALAVVGGTTLAVSNIARRVSQLLQPFVATDILAYPSLEDILNRPLPSGAAVLILSELDEPAWQAMTDSKFQGMREMLRHAGHLLWVTTNRGSANPYSNMMVGMGRSVALEYGHFSQQFVDFDVLPKGPLEHARIAEHLLQLVCSHQPEYSQVLYSLEDEVCYRRGQLHIPRLVHNVFLNNRINCERRDITEQLSLDTSPVHLSCSQDGALSLSELSGTRQQPEASEVLGQVQSSATSLFPFTASDGGEAFFISIGTLLDSGKRAIVLSAANSSLITATSQNTVQLLDDDDDRYAEVILQRVLAKLVAESLCLAAEGLPLWIHEATDDVLIQTLQETAAQHKTRLFMTTSQNQSGLTFLHPFTTKINLAQLVPRDVTRFASLRSDTAESITQFIENSIQNVDIFLPSRTKNGIRSVALTYNRSQLFQFIQKSCAFTQVKPNVSSSILDIAALPNSLDGLLPSAVVNWDSTLSLPVRIKPIDTNLFSPTKTYLLVGMTGELGMSLCSWMIDNGARHIAVSSRTPSVAPEILVDFQRRQANVRLFALDITDKTALTNVYNDIVSSMPPVGGVANAAMVLHDTAFDTMALDEFEKVLRPKVQGSQNLDDLFHSAPLDFFILFSSLSCVVGTRGQANYGAANMYMHALAAQRRKRGVAASIMDIAMLLGVGYIARSVDQLFDKLSSDSYMTISEPEFHTIFAAAIASGHPDSGQPVDLTTGLKPHSGAPWSKLPRFSHFQADRISDSNSTANKHGASSLAKVQTQLLEAESSAQALEILQRCFVHKLQHILQVPSDDIDLELPLIQLGIDSLVAVEIRSWFLKELSVDIPVLRVLGGVAASDLCRDALARLPTPIATDKPVTPTSPPSDVKDDDKGFKAQSSSASSDYTPSTTGSLLGLDRGSREDETAATTGYTTPAPRATEPEKSIGSAPKYERIGDMSRAQAALYFLHTYVDDKSANNVMMGGQLNGRLDIDRFRLAVQRVAAKHQALRSAFFIDPDAHGKPVQAVLAESQIRVHQQHVGPEFVATTEFAAQQATPLDIETGETMSITFFSQSPSVHHVVFCYHHIILDGISWTIFLKDLNLALCHQSLGPTPQQCIDLSSKQLLEYNPQRLAKEVDFWANRLKSAQTTLPLYPFSKTQHRRVQSTYSTETVEIMQPDSWTALVKKTSAKLKTTPFQLYLAALAAFLAKTLGIDKFCIGIIDVNRFDTPDFETVGYFLNQLPLYFEVDSNATFEALVKQTTEVVYSALQNSKAHFNDILDAAQITRSADQHPLFQVALNYRLGASAQTPLGDAQLQWTSAVPPKTPYDIMMDITEVSGPTQISLTVQSYLYSRSDAQSLAGWYTSAMESLVAEPSTRISSLRLSESTQSCLLNASSSGETKQPTWSGTLAHRVDQMAAQYPNSVAIKDGSSSLTYTQMMERVSHICLALKRLNIPRSSYIGVYLHPQVDVACALLAIMRLGLVYVPLDPRNPVERLSAIASDCKCAAIICDSETHQGAQTLSGQLIDLSTAIEQATTTVSVSNVAELDEPGFAIYTSGTTGKPKGVLLSHISLVNQIWAITEEFGVGREVVLQQSAFGFDLSLEQLLIPLCNGGTLVFAPKEARGDPEQLATIIHDQGITYTEFVPSEYLVLLRYASHILRRCTSWKFAFSGGEKLNQQLYRGFHDLQLAKLRLINLYGPAEATLSCTRGEVFYREEYDSEKHGFSGFPMPNYTIFIMDEHLEPVPVGFPGEICITGVGVAMGYINKPEETDLKFVPGKANTKMYRTGDKGRLLPDGSLQFFGRIDGDTQVKINGIRIELDEISQVILTTASPALSAAAASYRSSSGLLVAFVTFAADFTGDKDAFLETLKSRLALPTYMRPSIIISVDAIPRSVNGKRDQGAIDKLPLPSTPALTGSGNDVFSETEAKVRQAWEETLPHKSGVTQLVPDSDFFHVGGNSLLLIKLQSVLRTLFGRQIGLPSLFQSSTIRTMASLLASDTAGVVQVDFDVEISSLIDNLPYKPATKTKSKDANLSVVLTGATGFLGQSILAQLVDDSRVEKVHCIAIRSSENSSGSRITHKSDKIIQYPGDLSDLRLGLSDEQFTTLAETTDLVIHNGADVSFLKSYQTLRRVNVISTRTLAELALRGGIPLHFVSTAGVSAVSGDDTSLGETPPPARRADSESLSGYVDSKWVCEAFLARAAKENGLAAWIHRPASVVGEGSPALDIVSNVVKLSEVLGAVPKLEGRVQGEFDFISVGQVASGISQTAVASAGKKESGQARFVNHCNEEKLPPARFREFVEKTAGRPVVVQDADVWVDAAKEVGLALPVYHYLESALSSGRIILPSIHK